MANIIRKSILTEKNISEIIRTSYFHHWIRVAAIKTQVVTNVVSRSAAWYRLAACLDEIHKGPWKFIQLRGGLLDHSCIDGDDIDLLCSEKSVNALLDHAYQWVQNGDCHLRVVSRRPDKVELTLFSRDGQHCLEFDLWVNLWQLDYGKQRLTFADCADCLSVSERSVDRLPIDLEACIYVQHLLTKRKNINTEKSQHRLRRYVDRCRQAGFTSLANLLQDICHQRVVTNEHHLQTWRCLKSRLNLPQIHLARSRLNKIRTKFREARLAAPRQTRLISIMGCDGAGKTTLAHALKEYVPEVKDVFTGKHLYRKSLIHKAAVIFIRPFLLQSREKFDETLAPIVYLRACLGLRIRQWKQKYGLTLIDRSIIDFIYLDRKTDFPTFSRCKILADFFGKRIPTIHCVVSYDTVTKRKLEMSVAGHRKYNSDMFHHLSRRTPTDYLAFNNDSAVHESVIALKRMISTVTGKPSSDRGQGISKAPHIGNRH